MTAQNLNPTFLDRSNLQGEFLLDWNWNDTSWNGNNWTPTNITWVTSSRWYVSEVWSFNGTSSDFSTPYDLSGTNTISIWLYEEWATGVFHHIYDNDSSSTNRSICFFRRSTSTFEIYAWSTTKIIQDWTVLNYIPQNTWVNLIIIQSSWDNKVYVNSVLRSSSTTTFSWTSNNLTFWKRYTNIEYFDWKMWLIRIYDKILSQEEINNLYLEWLRRLWPKNLLFNNTNFSKYSLPNLENGKVLEISRAAVSGTYYDQSGNGNNSTTIVWVTDSTLWLNNVMTFDWVNDYIQVWTNVSINTLVVRFKPDNEITTSDTEWLASRWNDIFGIRFGSVTVNATNEIITIVDWGSADVAYWDSSDIPSITQKWHHMVITWDGSDYRLIYDWVDKWTAITFWTPWQIALNRFWTYRDAWPFFDWQIPSIRMFSEVWSVEQAQQDFYSNFIES